MDVSAVCPAWVATEGQEIWGETLRELQARHMLERASVRQVATYCQTWAQYAESTAQLNDKGMIVPRLGKDGEIVGVDVSPWYKVQQETLSRLRVFWADWRLLPKDVKPDGDSGERRGAGRLLDALQRSGKGPSAEPAGTGGV